MKLTSLPNAGYHIGTKNYDFDLFEGIEAARLSLKNSTQVYWFSPSGSVNTLKRCEEVATLEKWQKKEEKGTVTFTRVEKSVLWKKKQTTIICTESAIELFMTVEGAGDVSDVRFCRACINGIEYGFAGNLTK
jgi:hypothetical protein